MKWLKYHILMIRLNYQYHRKLKMVARNRFITSKYGLQALERQRVHNWMAGERHRIYMSVYGAK